LLWLSAFHLCKISLLVQTGLSLTMACASHVLVASIILSQALALPIASDEKLTGSMIRRHADSVRMSPSGEMMLEQREEKVDPAPVDDTPKMLCDHDFVLSVETNGRDCPAGTFAVIYPETCKYAATKLEGISETIPTNFTAENGWVNALPFPKNCFALNGQIYYNPTQVAASSTEFQGKAICQRTTYPNAEKDKESTECSTLKDSTDSTPYQAITNYTECRMAFECVVGVGGNQEQEFEDGGCVVAATYAKDTRPQGCYREPLTGNFNFNPRTAASSGKIEGSAVCKHGR